VDEFKRILGDPVDRRRFMKRMSAAGLGIAAITLLDGVGPGIGLTRRASAKAIAGSAAFPNIPGKSITEIVLNYALTLEFLEADLYRQALNQASGLALTTPLAEDPFSYNPTVGTGGLSADAAEAGYEYLVEFAYVEAAHRDFLRATLAKLKAPITTPDANGYKFPGGIGTDIKALLTQILPLEETGVRAYLGALTYLKPSKPYLSAAATIYSTEARHSAAINYILGNDPGPIMRDGDQEVTATPYPSQNTFEYFLTPTQVLTAAAVYFN
jgi:hypothetical protein